CPCWRTGIRSRPRSILRAGNSPPSSLRYWHRNPSITPNLWFVCLRSFHAFDIVAVRGRRLARQHGGHELAALDRAGVDANGDREGDAIRVGTERALLRLQDRLVLIEGAHDAFADDVVERAVVEADLAHDAPEVMRGGRGLGRDQVEHLALERLALVAGLGRHRAVLDHVEAGRREVVGVPAVDAAGEAGGLPVEGRRL